MNAFSPKMEEKAKVSTTTLPIPYCTKVLVTAIRYKRKKYIDVEKEKITLSLLIGTTTA